MISGAHVILASKEAEGDRAFFRDVLQFKSVDAGHGWLIFALPPAEVAMHPAEDGARHELYLMCDDLEAEMAALKAKCVACAKVRECTLGIRHQDRVAGRRPCGSLSAQAPHRVGVEIALLSPMRRY